MENNAMIFNGKVDITFQVTLGELKEILNYKSEKIKTGDSFITFDRVIADMVERRGWGIEPLEANPVHRIQTFFSPDIYVNLVDEAESHSISLNDYLRTIIISNRNKEETK